MVINMEEAKLKTLSQIKAFLDGTSEVTFRVSKGERNQFIERVFKRFGYGLAWPGRKRRIAAIYRAHDWVVTAASDTIGTTIPQGWEAI